MAGSGAVILFVVSLVGLTIWSLIYFTFASHYFLTTLCDSSAGQDEIQYPSETIADWWWKPVFCLWVLAAWLVPVTLLLAPLTAYSTAAFAIAWVMVLWLVYPLSLISVLHSQNWFAFMHPIVAWRMLRHYGAFAYVHLLTLLSASVCVGLLFGAFTHSFLWALPAAFVLPTAILFYARHWGRLAWLSLNFLPRKKKRRRAGDNTPQVDSAPEMDVQEIDPADEGIREGLPPGHSHGFQAGVPLAAGGLKAGAAPAVVEEEDEWATEKKPYPVVGGADFTTSAPEEPSEEKADADKPLVVSKFYDDKHEREQEAKRKAKEEAKRFGLPPPSRKTPTFRDALFFGVWRFMIYERTLGVWVNLVALTIVELFFLFMVVQFWPRLPE